MRQPMQRTTHDPTVLPHSDVKWHICVRCGRTRPEPELFICARCHADANTVREVRAAEEHLTDFREQRRALVAAGWHGGWWR